MQNEKAVPCKKQKSCKQKAVLSHPDMNPNAPERKEDWKVYFNGSLWGHHGRGRARRWNANTRSALILPQASF